MDLPFTDERHEDGANRESQQKDDSHDGTVDGTGMILTPTPTGDGIVTLLSASRIGERVAIAVDASLGKVDGEIVGSIMLIDVGTRVACVQGAALLPSTNPMVGPCQVNASRTRPMYVRHHSFVRRAASAEQFDITHAIIIRHVMTLALSCTQSHVA